MQKPTKRAHPTVAEAPAELPHVPVPRGRSKMTLRVAVTLSRQHGHHRTCPSVMRMRLVEGDVIWPRVMMTGSVRPHARASAHSPRPSPPPALPSDPDTHMPSNETCLFVAAMTRRMFTRCAMLRHARKYPPLAYRIESITGKQVNVL